MSWILAATNIILALAAVYAARNAAKLLRTTVESTEEARELRRATEAQIEILHKQIELLERQRSESERQTRRSVLPVCSLTVVSRAKIELVRNDASELGLLDGVSSDQLQALWELSPSFRAELPEEVKYVGFFNNKSEFYALQPMLFFFDHPARQFLASSVSYSDVTRGTRAFLLTAPMTLEEVLKFIERGYDVRIESLRNELDVDFSFLLAVFRTRAESVYRLLTEYEPSRQIPYGPPNLKELR